MINLLGDLFLGIWGDRLQIKAQQKAADHSLLLYVSLFVFLPVVVVALAWWWIAGAAK